MCSSWRSGTTTLSPRTTSSAGICTEMCVCVCVCVCACVRACVRARLCETFCSARVHVRGALEKLEAQDGAPVVAWLPLRGGLAGADGAGVEAGAEVQIEFSYEQVKHVDDIVWVFVSVGTGV